MNTSMNTSGSSMFSDVSGQEASDILAAALQQMDGIIAGMCLGKGKGLLMLFQPYTAEFLEWTFLSLNLVQLIDSFRDDMM